MSGFDNIEQLENVLDMAMDDVISKIIEETQKNTQDIVLQLAYIENEPVEYKRTYEFLNAFSFNKTAIQKHIVELFFDDSEITTHDKMHHTIDSQDLFTLLESGLNTGGNPLVSNKGNFVNAIYNWINANFDRMVIEGFAELGIELTKS